jgi:DNA-binding MarR family transcriptional regulator
VEHGHVSRIEDPADRRQKRIEIRPEGTALLDRMNDARVREMTVVLAQLDPQLQDQLTQIVASVIAALQSPHRAPGCRAGR